PRRSPFGIRDRHSLRPSCPCLSRASTSRRPPGKTDVDGQVKKMPRAPVFSGLCPAMTKECERGRRKIADPTLPSPLQGEGRKGRGKRKKKEKPPAVARRGSRIQTVCVRRRARSEGPHGA